VPSTEGAFWIYDYNGPSSIDGQYYTDNIKTKNKTPPDPVYYVKPGMTASFRRGLTYDVDENYNPISVFKDYSFNKTYTWNSVIDRETNGYMSVNNDRLTATGLRSYDDTERWDT